MITQGKKYNYTLLHVMSSITYYLCFESENHVKVPPKISHKFQHYQQKNHLA